MRLVRCVLMALILVSAGGCDFLDYAEQVEELQDKNARLQKQVDDLKEKNKELQKRLDEYKDSVAEMYQ